MGRKVDLRRVVVVQQIMSIASVYSDIIWEEIGN